MVGFAAQGHEKKRDVKKQDETRDSMLIEELYVAFLLAQGPWAVSG